MSQKIILATIFGLLSLIVSGQELKWIYKIGGTSADNGVALTMDDDQSIYDMTTFSGSLTIVNQSFTSRGSQDIVIRKSSSSGFFQWVRHLGGKGQDIAYDIVADNDDNVYLTGSFTDSLFYNNTFLIKGDAIKIQSFILKINPEGNVIWVRKLEADVAVMARTITKGQGGEMIISGSFEGNGNFGAGFSAGNNGGMDGFLIKISGASGNTTFMRTFGGPENDTVLQHFTDNQNNYYLAGDFRQTVDFDPGPAQQLKSNMGMADGYVLKLSATGNFVWVRTFGSSGLDQAVSLTADGQRNVIVTGSFSNSVNFSESGNPAQSKGSTDIFLVKLDEFGSTQWHNTYGDSLQDAGSRVIVNTNGIIYLAGSFRTKADFNPSPEFNNGADSNGGTDGFIALYNQDGTYNEHFTLGGMANDQINDFALKSNGELVSVGAFGAITDFDPSSSESNIFSTGGLDGFLWNTFICVNPYIKNVRAFKPEICPGEKILVQILEGYLNSATQWSWQRNRCDNITFASGNFLNINIDTSSTFYVKGFGGCVTNDQCKKIEVRVFEDSVVYNEVKLCQGDTLVVGASRYTTAGSYVDSLVSVSGCDSIVFSEVTLYPKYFFSQSFQICDGDTVWVGNTPYTFTGVFTNLFESIDGCDSLIVTNLTVLPTNVQNAEAIICKGDSVTIGSDTYYNTGTYFQSSIGTNGCEDLLIVRITALETEFSQFADICQGDTIRVGSSKYTMPGIYKDTLDSSFGCDSIITTTVIQRERSVISRNISICQGDSIYVGNRVYFSTGTYIDTLTNVFGCDSIVNTALKVNPVPGAKQQSFTLCEGQTVNVGNNTYGQSGTYTDTLLTVFGCDSVVITKLKVYKKDHPVSREICVGESVTVGGMTFSSTGMYKINLKNNAGCDSIITLNLLVNNVKRYSQAIKICPGGNVKVGNSIYTSPGMYSDTLTSKSGCDSIVTTAIQWNHVSRNLTRSICQGSFVIINGKTYNLAGNFRDTLLKSDGCDSILNISIQVNPVYNIDTLFEICKGESIKVGSSTYFNPGKYTEFLSSVGGCDSIVNFEVQVVNFVPVFFAIKDTLKAFNIPGAIYQWHECINGEKVPFLGATQTYFPLFKSGSYALSITYRGCTYFSSCQDFIVSKTQDFAQEETFTIIPNPASGSAGFNCFGQGEMVLLTMQGKQVRTFIVRQGYNSVDISDLAPGIYLAGFRSQKGNSLRKLIVTRD